jgi:hypothetical protein
MNKKEFYNELRSNGLATNEKANGIRVHKLVRGQNKQNIQVEWNHVFDSFIVGGRYE